ncbi:unnamed protein product [Soboliphyme baturini]|uniref:DSHCT domain-containing protein n=1 Tax=Soboliphyme baturini TaxID=241478 RepID=A0A183IFQ8_9BILA|nr:unnamed protein product [Soboliphyme baturini]
MCCDLRKAARMLGSQSVEEKFEECAALIKRDIVFVQSLYTSE